MSRRVLRRVVGLRDPGLLACGLICGVVAAALIAAPLAWAAAGVSFVVMDLATDDRDKA